MYTILGITSSLATIVASSAISLNIVNSLEKELSKRGYEIDKKLLDKNLKQYTKETSGLLGSIVLFIPGINLVYAGISHTLTKNIVAESYIKEQKSHTFTIINNENYISENVDSNKQPIQNFYPIQNEMSNRHVLVKKMNSKRVS